MRRSAWSTSSTTAVCSFEDAAPRPARPRPHERRGRDQLDPTRRRAHATGSRGGGRAPRRARRPRDRPRSRDAGLRGRRRRSTSLSTDGTCPAPSCRCSTRSASGRSREGRSSRYRAWAWSHPPDAPCPGGGESRAEAASRYAAALEELLDTSQDVVLAVSHSLAVRYALDASDGSFPAARVTPVEHAGVHEFSADAVARAAETLRRVGVRTTLRRHAARRLSPRHTSGSGRRGARRVGDPTPRAGRPGRRGHLPRLGRSGLHVPLARARRARVLRAGGARPSRRSRGRGRRRRGALRGRFRRRRDRGRRRPNGGRAARPAVRADGGPRVARNRPHGLGPGRDGSLSHRLERLDARHPRPSRRRRRPAAPRRLAAGDGGVLPGQRARVAHGLDEPLDEARSDPRARSCRCSRSSIRAHERTSSRSGRSDRGYRAVSRPRSWSSSPRSKERAAPISAVASGR